MLIFTSTIHGITLVDPATGKIDWELDQNSSDRCVKLAAGRGGPGDCRLRPGLRGTPLRGVAAGPPAKGRSRRGLRTYQGPSLGAHARWSKRPAFPMDRRRHCLLRACWPTGELLWRERVGGAFYSSPVWVGHRLYCIAKNGEVVVVAAADKFEVLARVPLGEPSFATAAVAGGAMYLRTCGHLFSLGGPRGGGDSVRCLKEPAVLTRPLSRQAGEGSSEPASTPWPCWRTHTDAHTWLVQRSAAARSAGGTGSPLAHFGSITV